MLAFMITGCGKEELANPYHAENLNMKVFFEGEENIIKAEGFAKNLCVPADSDQNTENVNAEGFGFFSVDDAEVLSQKNVYERLYPASTTKIMTCLLALELCDLDEMVTVPEESVITVAGSSMADLTPGDHMLMEDMLHALMVPSGNDAAAAIAVHIGGTIENFAEMMNRRAKELGATSTHFVNPHGLPDEDHYTTPYDLYLIFNEALKYPDFRRISSTVSYTAEFTNIKDKQTPERTATWDSGNGFYQQVFALPEGVHYTAGKTGHTNAAGFCLVLAEEDAEGKDYISVVLKAPDYESLYNGTKKLVEKRK